MSACNHNCHVFESDMYIQFARLIDLLCCSLCTSNVGS